MNKVEKGLVGVVSGAVLTGAVEGATRLDTASILK